MPSDHFVIAGRDGRLARRILELLRAARVPCRVEIDRHGLMPDHELPPVAEPVSSLRGARLLAVGPAQLPPEPGEVIQVAEAVRAELDGSFASSEHGLISVAPAAASVVLRVAPYAESLIPRLVWAAHAGRFFAVEGQPGVPYITLDDAALVAATVLTSGYGGAQILDIAGPQVVTSSELASALSRTLGRAIPHTPLPWNRYERELASSPLSPDDVALIRANDHRTGRLVTQSLVAQQVTGVRMRSIAQFLERNVELIRQQASRFGGSLGRTQVAAQPGF